MNTSRSTRFGLIARSTLGALAFVSLVGVAQSQTTPAAAPAQTGTSKDTQKAYDPYSPFVWDALGATPSIRLPWQSAKPSASVGEQKVDKADKAEKAAPSAAGVVEARIQGAQAAR